MENIMTKVLHISTNRIFEDPSEWMLTHKEFKVLEEPKVIKKTRKKRVAKKKVEVSVKTPKVTEEIKEKE
jgi:hypothetical protein